MIRIDAVWLAVEPLDMRAGTETALARVVRVFGDARAHHAYLFDLPSDFLAPSGSVQAANLGSDWILSHAA